MSGKKYKYLVPPRCSVEDIHGRVWGAGNTIEISKQQHIELVEDTGVDNGVDEAAE